MRFAAVALAAFLLPAHAPPAVALGIAPDPIPILVDIPAAPPVLIAPISIEGSIIPIGFETGLPAGGTVHLGAVGPGDTTLLFQISIASAFLGDTAVGIPDIEVNTGGPGPFPSACGSIAGTGDTALSAGCFFSFDLAAAETSDIVFVSFPALEPGDSLRFLTGDIAPILLGEAVVTLPELEPGVGTLLGLAAFVVMSKRRRGVG